VPPVHGQLRPSEAVLAAESSAKRLLQLPGSWARRLEQQGAAQLAALWLACIDETCAWYWKQWEPLIGTFENTLRLKRPKDGEARPVESSFDAALLNECMQLYAVMQGSIRTQFSAFQAEVLQLAAQMQAAPGHPFGQAALAKLRDPDVWCSRLGIPSVASLRNAHSALDGAPPNSAALRARSPTAIPAATASLATADKQMKDLVTQCCVQPVMAVLGTYSDMPDWAKAGELEVPALLGGLMPLQCITAVGEHLFSLVRVLEQSPDSSQASWLPIILDAVADIALQRVLQIKRLSSYGAQQLVVDLEYLRKVADALGGGEDDHQSGDVAAKAGAVVPKAAVRLGELLKVLGHLAAQRKRRDECTAKGEEFREEPFTGPAPDRRSERAFRAALGLAS